ncbi:hypothetical protein OHB14_28525 [Streptomyces sp. NBC_01613]|uniref:hypothetical protein n=1 Tax=Streptomyces sp. NBC_01613 TaxID=2975896 RepID=UPI003869C3BB
MTWPAALPGAALRVMRTTAGRRALQVVLLVGGLFALGFLCGEQAHAAEGAPLASAASSSSEVVPTAPADGVRSLTSSAVGTVGRLVNPPAAPEVHHPTAPAAEPRPSAPAKPEPTAPAAPAPSEAKPKHNPTTPAEPSVHHPVTESVSRPGAGDAADQVLSPLTDNLVQSVGARVVQPVGDLVEKVTAGLGEVTAQIPPLSSLPSLPVLSGSPSMPGLPSLPGLPAAPGRLLPAPVTQAPQPGAAGHSAADGAVDGRRSGARASGAEYGPRFAADITADAASARGGGQRAAGAGYAPVQQAPDGDPTGAPPNRAAVDNNTSRHGDAHAVALNHRAPLRLVPGAAARAAAAGTRDRHRDIPVFPG